MTLTYTFVFCNWFYTCWWWSLCLGLLLLSLVCAVCVVVVVLLLLFPVCPLSPRCPAALTLCSPLLYRCWSAVLSLSDLLPSLSALRLVHCTERVARPVYWRA